MVSGLLESEARHVGPARHRDKEIGKLEIGKPVFDCRKLCLYFAFLNILRAGFDQTQNTRSVLNLLIYNFVITLNTKFC